MQLFQEWPRQTKPKKGQFTDLSQGHSGTKVRCEPRLFSQGKTPEFPKSGRKIHELFGLALSLVRFAGATPAFSFLGKDSRAAAGASPPAQQFESSRDDPLQSAQQVSKPVSWPALPLPPRPKLRNASLFII